MADNSVLLLWLPAIICIVAVLVWRRRREQGPHETIHLRVPSALYRTAQQPLFFYSVSSLTGVSITFSPLFLFWLGSSGARMFDWRVIACFLVTYLVPSVYLRFGGLILVHAWKARTAGKARAA